MQQVAKLVEYHRQVAAFTHLQQPDECVLPVGEGKRTNALVLAKCRPQALEMDRRLGLGGFPVEPAPLPRQSSQRGGFADPSTPIHEGERVPVDLTVDELSEVSSRVDGVEWHVVLTGFII